MNQQLQEPPAPWQSAQAFAVAVQGICGLPRLQSGRSVAPELQLPDPPTSVFRHGMQHVHLQVGFLSHEASAADHTALQ